MNRYELTGINAFNFVLRRSLGGGGIASLRPDPQVFYTTLYRYGAQRKAYVCI